MIKNTRPITKAENIIAKAYRISIEIPRAVLIILCFILDFTDEVADQLLFILN